VIDIEHMINIGRIGLFDVGRRAAFYSEERTNSAKFFTLEIISQNWFVIISYRACLRFYALALFPHIRPSLIKMVIAVSLSFIDTQVTCQSVALICFPRRRGS
jgi:hypothetical protein